MVTVSFRVKRVTIAAEVEAEARQLTLDAST